MPKKIINSRYRDLGTVLTGTSVADEGMATSDIFYGTQGYTKAIFHCKSTQAWELWCYKYNEDGTVDWGNTIQAGLGQTSGVFSGLTIDATGTICGHGIKFGMKNKSGGAAANFELKVQLIG
jgi:hypothetical protein